MKHLFRLSSLLFALEISFSTALAQGTGPHVIKGTVYLPGNRLAQRIEVVLENQSGRQLTRAFVDQDGRYAFPGLGFGNYRVVIQEFGHNYAPAWQDVEIAGSQNSIIIRTVDFNLQPKAKKEGGNAPGTVSAFKQDVPAEAEQEYAKADKSLEKGPNNEGIRHLKRAIEIFPDYYLALARLGAEYARAGAYEMAIAPLRKACNINVNSMGSHLTLGMTLVELGEYKEAIEALKVCQRLDAQSVNAHLYMGVAQLQIGRLEEAEKNLKRAYEIGGGAKAAVAHLHLATIYDRQGDYDKAADELEAYLKDVPDVKNKQKIKDLIKRLREKKKKGG